MGGIGGHPCPGILEGNRDDAGPGLGAGEGAGLARLGEWIGSLVRLVSAEDPIPCQWAGRAVLVSLDRVSTDAIVYANGGNAAPSDGPLVRWTSRRP